MQEEFEEFAEKAKTLPDTISNEDKLLLYGLYKQAIVGTGTTGIYRPSALLETMHSSIELINLLLFKC